MLNQRLLLYNSILSMIFHRVRTLSCIEPTSFLANFLLIGAWEIKHYKCGFFFFKKQVKGQYINLYQMFTGLDLHECI